MVLTVLWTTLVKEDSIPMLLDEIIPIAPPIPEDASSLFASLLAESTGRQKKWQSTDLFGSSIKTLMLGSSEEHINTITFFFFFHLSRKLLGGRDSKRCLCLLNDLWQTLALADKRAASVTITHKLKFCHRECYLIIIIIIIRHNTWGGIVR